MMLSYILCATPVVSLTCTSSFHAAVGAVEKIIGKG